ncbi:VOC family protein [Streptomyces sp. C10-9-1]|uniref:VOC family protein n=1 Tax=Streptomyces sp. C10-9-1 TaxID=1859285 RepID=UPI0021130E29|nr:VOC family protein [Streptomyces sp. C10-9-1]MCQ6553441.1 VOC family protein [Streptomyces sp. C10-9-1]
MNDKTTRSVTAPTSESVYGAPCWVSLMARDLGAAQDFYGTVLGWEFRKGRLGDDFTIALADGVPVAGIGALAPRLTVAVAWTPYFAVEDADLAGARIRERSGTVAVGPISLSTGRGLLAADRDGAVFGVWEGELVHDWPAWRDHAPAWIRLLSRDAFDSAIFYGEVFDWAGGRAGCCEVTYAEGAVLLHRDGRVLARLTSGADPTSGNPLLHPRWHVHFAVKDVEETASAARRCGATLLGERSTSTGAEVSLRDPDGAIFTVSSYDGMVPDLPHPLVH